MKAASSSFYIIFTLIILSFGIELLFPCQETQESKVRIIKENVVLRLRPNRESIEIKSLQLGAVFELIDTSGEWMKLKLPPDKEGLIITGYIHKNEAENISEIDLETINPVIIQLKDGSLIKGIITREDEDEVTVVSLLGELNVSRNLIEDLKKIRGGTGRPIGKDGVAQTAIKNAIKEGDLVPLSSVDMAPVLTRKVMPDLYMKETRLVTQVFKVNVLISEKGDVESVEVVEGKNTYEYRAVREAVKKWKFKPAIKDGVKVKVWKQFNISVNIK
jgi:TonB family protein